MDWFVLRFCDWREEWRLCHASWLCCFTANRSRTAGAWGKFCFSAWLLVKSRNRSWNRDFSRFHPILTISPDFNPISPIFDFFKRFNTQSMFWLVKSYDFTSQNAILTTLASSLRPQRNSLPSHYIIIILVVFVIRSFFFVICLVTRGLGWICMN